MTYRLRWYFNFLNRADYYGVWGCADPRRPAWCHGFEGINRAMIQGKDEYGNIKILADCPGEDFQNFQWMAIALLQGKGSKILSGKMPSKLVGIQMQTRHGQIQVFADGSVNRNSKTYDGLNFATYGR